MTAGHKESDTHLAARLGDAIEKCNRGSVAHLPFLTPRARKQAERELRAAGAWEQAFFFGGYPDAERVCLFLLPDYYNAMLGDVPCACEFSVLHDALREDLNDTVSAVRITGSGYRVLTHRDYLGSILGLGLERDALGDVAIQNEREAVVFCPKTISDFLIENLKKVASDTVKCKPYVLDDSFTDGKQYRPISDTVASPRLDCVVAALCNLSRGDAQGAVRAGLVEVDYDGEDRIDCVVDIPCVISVRGVGKFVLRSLGSPNRRGRLPLIADKYI
ncbi:MAG: hypothetical protein IKC59_05635 [Clostridia bacterium]|nr:hypothetical protein [Clostridia bacterium]